MAVKQNSMRRALGGKHMLDLKKLTAENLSKDGWRTLISKLDEVTKARTDPRFFRQVALKISINRLTKFVYWP